MSEKLEQIAGLKSKLKNRRVSLHKLSDDSWLMQLKILEGRKVVETKLRISNEAMTRIIFMYGAIQTGADCESHWAILHENGFLRFGKIGG